MFPLSSGWYSISHSPHSTLILALIAILHLHFLFNFNNMVSTYIHSYYICHSTGTCLFITIACRWLLQWQYMVRTINVSDLSWVLNDITLRSQHSNILHPSSSTSSAGPSSNPANPANPATNPSHPFTWVYVICLISGCPHIKDFTLSHGNPDSGPYYAPPPHPPSAELGYPP